jgi:hypothetical protein
MSKRGINAKTTIKKHSIAYAIEHYILVKHNDTLKAFGSLS